MLNNLSTTSILNIPFVNESFDTFMTQIKNDINLHENRFVITANPEIAVHAYDNKDYLDLIKKSDYVVPDGIGIVNASKEFSTPIKERISGYDIFCDLLKWGNENNKSAYFIGSKPEVITDLQKKLNQDYPTLQIKGIHDGYFNNPNEILNEIKHTKPDMVFVGLGFPKQEEFIDKHRPINNGLWIGLGGSFDVMSGHVKRAPKFWINHHLEWLYRFITQPTRFKRMLAIPKFLRLVKKQKKDN
ncbi:WecB/TagA/CpsF family glycosyltransferase [Lactobacillus sp. S2-2]|uniref:WecB/TagA/CpsF family glycosyltransferase n=1 Tax=Lactobacillus sp. S2-2 TaxID=2692917 RepID=UPI001F27BBCA|nr:WecB/TagA/CpsF family glycosyltransferase [Lactobacillus sp. S2-2]MCF6515623.1 WecB/TagA/CpsF family glycosyltransferase [Lactobacillus sp. S2-2]